MRRGACLLLVITVSAAAAVPTPALDEEELHQKVVSLVTKCCGLHEIFDGEDRTCVQSEIEFQPIFEGPQPDVVDIIVGLNCKDGRYKLEPALEPEDAYELLTNGSLHLPNTTGGPQMVDQTSYCLETTRYQDSPSEIIALVCFPAADTWATFTFIVYPIGCVVSVPFLVVTAAIFTFFRELRDLRGKIATCLTLCLAVAFVCLAFVQTQGEVLTYVPCVILAHSMQFFFLSSFFWMNVMCYNTWWQRNLCEKEQPTTVAMEKKRFVFYSLYGWSVPTLITIVSIVANSNSIITTDHLRPDFGVSSCWFHTDRAATIYFYGPITVVLTLNLVFFLLIARLMYKKTAGHTRNEFARAAWRVIKDRRMRLFKQCLALFCLMGLNWILEVISWVSKGPIQLWILTDIINTLQGPILFYLLFWKNKRARKCVKDWMANSCSPKTQDLLVAPEQGGNGPNRSTSAAEQPFTMSDTVLKVMATKTPIVRDT